MTRELVQESPGATGLSDLVLLLEELASAIYKCDESHLYREIAEWGRFRAVFLLLPEQLLFGPPPIEEKPVIKDHLERLGVDSPPDLVSAIKCLCINFRTKRSASRKFGITDIYIKYPHVFQRMVEEQSGRCRYCGITIVYGENAALDHIWPFFLGDDPHDGSNWCLCCNECNIGKGEYPFYSLTSACTNWIGPNADGRLSLSTRFAALARDRACVRCDSRPNRVELTVRKRIESGCWILDNIVTACKHPCQPVGASPA
jgi:HNH endonuclease